MNQIKLDLAINLIFTCNYAIITHAGIDNWVLDYTGADATTQRFSL